MFKRGLFGVEQTQVQVLMLSFIVHFLLFIMYLPITQICFLTYEMNNYTYFIEYLLFRLDDIMHINRALSTVPGILSEYLLKTVKH